MQYNFSKWFQEMFSWNYEFFDAFWAFITFFGGEIFLILFIATIYWSVDKKTAKIIACSAIVAMSINGIIKDIAKIERPISNNDIRFVSIKNVFVNTKDMVNSYSFPSGHSQTAASIFLSAAMIINKKKFWIFASLFTVLVALSRIYLGVHWMSDVIVGVMLGLLIAYGIYMLYKKTPDKEIYLYIGMIVFGVFGLIFSKKADTFKGMGAVIGFGSGILFDKYLVNFDSSEGVLWKKILRVVIGIILIFAMKEGIKVLFKAISDSSIWLDFIRYLLITFFGIAIYPWITKKVRL